MIWACLALIPTAFVLSAILTAVLVRLGHRLGTFDSGGVAGQVKAARRRVPNTGGVAVFLAIAGPMLVGLLVLGIGTDGSGDEGGTGWLTSIFPGLRVHLAGIHERAGEGFTLLAAMVVVHVMGLIDDRRPLRAMPKLAVMACVMTLLSVLTGSRLLTALDAVAGGPWLSYTITVLWLIVVTNAMNFLDNMDGLSGGIGLIASASFLAATLASPHPQWFIASALSLLIGSLGGFLLHNAPRPWSSRSASIFLGDGGSLVVGLLLGFLTVRTTYVDPSAAAGGGSASWFGIFMPLVVLAVPLYDFCTVVTLRLRQGKSPFVGDLQHVSHRLVERGLSRRGAVYVIWALTAATSCGAIALPELADWRAGLVGLQTALILCVLFGLEHASRHAVHAVAGRRAPGPGPDGGASP